MKIINPKVELLQEGDDFISHVVKCARVCYKKEDGDDKRTYNHLIANKHLSMLRHATVYGIFPARSNAVPNWVLDIYYNKNKYKVLHVGIDIVYDDYYCEYLVAANKHFMYEHPACYISDVYKVDATLFANHSELAWKMMRYTFIVDTQISTSRELNRVSPNNIAEQSTRYVYEDGTLCKPWWMGDEEVEMLNAENFEGLKNSNLLDYYNECSNSFQIYKNLVNRGMHRQDARGVLPIDTATRCAYTYSLNEWSNIIDLRYYGTTGKPHPNAKLIAGMIKSELEELGYEFSGLDL